MGLTNDMCKYYVNGELGSTPTPFDNSHAAIGVGDDSTSFSSGQTKLQAEANGSSSLRVGMDSGYPDQDPSSAGNSRKVRYQSTFGSSEATFSWQEWGVFNSTTSGGGTMKNREVENPGTKGNVQWIFQVDVELIT